MKLKTPTELGLSKWQFRNLCKLALFVRDSRPPPEFRMEWYNTDKDGLQLQRPSQAVHECGTSACLAGHGPLAGIKPKKMEYWGDYERRCFRGSNMLAAHFLFGSAHADSKTKAVRRVAYFLENGAPPQEDVRTWEAPSSFRPSWKLIAQHANS